MRGLLGRAGIRASSRDEGERQNSSELLARIGLSVRRTGYEKRPIIVIVYYGIWLRLDLVQSTNKSISLFLRVIKISLDNGAFKKNFYYRLWRRDSVPVIRRKVRGYIGASLYEGRDVINQSHIAAMLGFRIRRLNRVEMSA